MKKLLVNDLKDQYIGINVKQKVTIKKRQLNIFIFLNQILLDSIDCLFYFSQTKIQFLKI